ncbi:hypothetical protein DPMN_183647 [Dreissena polymorpha]|uniref:B box-type domain-containing protein n=1 Tax=Dreissena polymorpha TaxID=45954 RepID=A0A9D4I3S3_DREPO|nr:hypothetical protein DPMN_183647 [Dreissena polymorpha]
MATFSQSTIEKGSDIIPDFLCSSCGDKKLDKMADCINLHSQLCTKHDTFGREHMKKWPVTKKVEDFLLKCDVHKDENLNMFCDEHSELCCTNCAFLNHRYSLT